MQFILEIKHNFDCQQSVLRKINPEDAQQIADPIVNALLQMFDASTRDNVCGTQEDALMAVGTLVEGRLLFVSMCLFLVKANTAL